MSSIITGICLGCFKEGLVVKRVQIRFQILSSYSGFFRTLYILGCGAYVYKDIKNIR